MINYKYARQLALAFILTTVIVNTLDAQGGPPKFIRDAVSNVEMMLDSEDDATIAAFIEEAMVNNEDRDLAALMEHLRTIRKEMRGLRDDIAAEADPDGVLLILSAGEVEKQLKIVMDFEVESISDLFIIKTPEPIDLKVDGLSEYFDQLEKDGMAGVVYIKIEGEVVCKRAFGLANKESGIPNTINTVFGTGSRPIDYTVAAIYLLDQKGLITLDDKISKYFSEVPEDKRSITIRHLLTGQSGFPDFFHTNDDWDPDLAWIDRNTAVKRILTQELLFEPGTAYKHSHSAFGLLAAVIEIVAERSYYSFISENFFDPAGMRRTGEYGDSKGLAMSDFAIGGGPQFVGLPNIPPNWGPTSWLIKGSGGMYSTLGDLLKFYAYIRSERVLNEEHNIVFCQPAVNVDGSDRGFELFSAYIPPNNEIFLLLNEQVNREKTRQLFRALERLIVPEK